MTGPFVVPYDPGWPGQFEAERARLERAFEGVPAVIEHVGSTAVEGLAAKPIIDICIGLDSLRHAESRVEAMSELGYEYVPEYESEMPNRRYFRRPIQRPRSHHVHCFRLGSPGWSRHLAFRDYLRAHPSVAAEYAQLKLRLATEFAGDRPAYTEAKSPFIARTLDAARREGVFA